MRFRYHMPLAVAAFLLAYKSRKQISVNHNHDRKIVVFRQWNTESVIRDSIYNLQNNNVQPIHALPSIKAISCQLYGNCNVQEILKDPNVLRVDDDIEIKIKPLPYIKTILNNPFTQNTILPWGVERINAPNIWQYYTGSGVKVAVVDTGVDLTHPMLVNNLRKGINIINPDEAPTDDNGHGTHVAGTIAATGGAGKVIGVAPNAKLYPVKAFDKIGKARLSDIGKAVEWCIQNDIRLINMSYGTAESNETLEAIYLHAYEQGAIMIAAAGNNGPDGRIGFPGRYPFTITVGATNKENQIASFSSRGKEVDICAPGVEILSCWLYGGLKRLKGTSMATPHVTGTVALLLEQYPMLSFKEIKQILRYSATNLVGVDQVMQGMGMVNAENAIQMLV